MIINRYLCVCVCAFACENVCMGFIDKVTSLLSKSFVLMPMISLPVILSFLFVAFLVVSFLVFFFIIYCEFYNIQTFFHFVGFTERQKFSSAQRNSTNKNNNNKFGNKPNIHRGGNNNNRWSSWVY